MSESSSAPDLLYNLYGDFMAPAFRMALLLDVFTPLAAGPAHAEAVAQARGCDIMTSDQPSEWASLVTLLTWAASGGAAYSFADYRG